MLWKSKPGELPNSSEEEIVMTNKSLVGTNGRHSPHRSTFPKTTTTSTKRGTDVGVVIYPFKGYSSNNGDSKFFLDLSLGENVVIKSVPAPGWFFGWRKYCPERPGLFPASHIGFNRAEYHELLEKVAEVCREWGSIRKKLFVEVHSYQFEAIGRGLRDLLESRKTLLNQALTQEQSLELARKITARIDWGNKKLGLDLIPWDWMIEDEDDDEEDTSQRVSSITPADKDAGRLFKLHQKSVEAAGGGTARGSATLTRRKSKGVLKEGKKDDLYVALADFSYAFSDDCEVSFTLYDGKRSISERHTLFQNHTHVPSSSFHIPKERPTIFKDVGANKRDLYLVVEIVRIGRMFYVESAGKKGVAKNRRFRRPYAAGVLPLSTIQTIEDDEFETTNNSCTEKPLKLYNSDEKDFHLIADLIIAQNQKAQFSKLVPVLNSFSVTVFWCSATALKTTSSVVPTKLIGLHTSVIAPPGEVRNDLYLTLSTIELLEKRQNKTGGAKSCNLEVQVQIIDDSGDEEILRSVENNPWTSLILHHVNLIKGNELIKFPIPIETFPKSKVRLIFRHCSAKDKTLPKKMFGVTWLNLMDKEGTTLRDGNHTLNIFKWGDESSLPLQSGSLPVSKDTVIINSLMMSTKFTMNPDLVNLLRWKGSATTGGSGKLKTSLQNLIQSPEAIEEIVRKFLQDVLDALFAIFSDEEGNSTEYSGDVFTLLVNIFQLLRTPAYSGYTSILDAYCKDQFSGALVYKGLLQSLRHYTTVLLNSVGEDITGLIQNAYRSLPLIFKFITVSQSLFAKATGGKLEDSFRRDVGALSMAFSKVFSVVEGSSSVFVETQSILLSNFDSVYTELLKVMQLGEVCTLVVDVFSSIPILKDIVAHPLSPSKLSAILLLVKSPLFRSSSASRARLLPVFCRHLRHHLAHREELKLCTEVLQEILTFLHSLKRKQKASTVHADIEIIASNCLEMLVQAVLVLERTSSVVIHLVTCLISLLELMDSCHYNRLWDEFGERKPLRDLLLRVFLLFRDLIKQDVFPSDWAFMKLLTNHVMLVALQEFCQPLITDFLKFFDVQLWSQYFTLGVTFITQQGIQLETFREWKKEWVLERFGDMRLKMGGQMLQLWNHLGDPEKRHFIPSMIGPFLTVTLVPEEELRQITLRTLFYDMMLAEFRLSGEIKETESELIDRLDLLMNSEEDCYGDEGYRKLFRDLHLQRLSQEKKVTNSSWGQICSNSINSLSTLQQLLLDYRSILRKSANSLESDENKDKLMQVTVNLLNFYREEKRDAQYLRYVYKLHSLHVSSGNFIEAGNTLLLHGKLLSWDRGGSILPEQWESSSGGGFPSQQKGERKEMIYLRALGYFDQGKAWEKGLPLCKELGEEYEKRYEYLKLSRLLQTQAAFYDRILNELRPDPEYFRVLFIGKGFSSFVRGKEFVYRGEEYQRLGGFMHRIMNEWPTAQIVQKSGPVDNGLEGEDKQFIQICSVKPRPLVKMSPEIPSKIRSYCMVNDVHSFVFDRRIEKAPENDAQEDGNEFKSMWVERTTLKTNSDLPGILPWAEVIEKKTLQLSPIEFACERMEEANAGLLALIGTYSQTDGVEEVVRNVNPLSMRLQGMLDAAVMGGIPKYMEAFFNEEFMKKEESSHFVLKLIGLLQEQVHILSDGLTIHGHLVPPGVVPLHQRLLECHAQMAKSVAETETLVASTLASLHNLTLRRSESGTVLLRESFRGRVGGIMLGGKSIVNSPLPPVPKGGSSNMNGNRLSSGGYGHVIMRVGSSARDHGFNNDDDEAVYTQLDADGVAPATTPTSNKPPAIPGRNRKLNSATVADTEYILMPPSRLREIGRAASPSDAIVAAPTIPPKPPTNRTSSNGGTASPPPPPLLPRRPTITGPAPAPLSKTSSTTSLNSGSQASDAPPGTPPPVPPKPPKGGPANSEDDSTYMNKAELEDELNRNNSPNPTNNSVDLVDTDSASKRGSGHKEYFVPPGVMRGAGDGNSNPAQSNGATQSEAT